MWHEFLIHNTDPTCSRLEEKVIGEERREERQNNIPPLVAEEENMS